MNVGVELRDSSVIAVAVNDDGRVAARVETACESPARLGAAAVDALERLAPSAPDAAAVRVASVVPDSVECQAACSVISRRRGHAPVAAEPAGTAAAIAEAWTGAGRNTADVVYFAAGDHITAGIVRGGVAVRGAHGQAPAAAWLALNPVEREDYRKVGCLEAEAAAAGVVRRLIWRVKAGDPSIAQELAGGDLAAVAIEHVLRAARDGDGVAVSVVRDTAKYLGMAAANLVIVADPEMLVVGGIMASDADLLMPPFRAELSRRLPKPIMNALALEAAVLGDDAAAIGAARLGAVALR